MFHLKGGPRRFNQLRRLMPAVTQRMLTLQLRALEADGLIARTVLEHIPPHVEYSFTERGLTLGPILEAMEAWGERHAGDPSDPDAPAGLVRTRVKDASSPEQ